jgi:hypothetical protein
MMWLVRGPMVSCEYLALPVETGGNSGDPVPNQSDEILHQSVFSPNIGLVQYSVGNGMLSLTDIGSCCTVRVVDAELGR